jgi:nitroreductase
VCPENAISIEGLNPDRAVMDDGGKLVTPPGLLRLMGGRRSVRRFQEQELDNTTLEQLIDTAGYIPSGGNRHAYSFTVITKGESRERLSRELNRIYSLRRKLLNNALLRKMFSLFVDSRTRAFLLDPTYLKRTIDLLDQYGRGDDPIFYRAPAIIIIHSREVIPTPVEDSVLAAYNIVLMAETLGLGTCLVSLAQNAINSSRKCKKILNLDPSDRVDAVVVIGHPAVDFLRAIPKVRKPINWCGTLN